MSYGFTIAWTRFDGAKSWISCDNCDTLEDAILNTLHSAKSCGWTPPKWYQWWRWKDTRIPNKTP